jgi:hypothetical protein
MGIYSAMPYAGPIMCPKTSDSFPTEPNLYVSSCSGTAVDVIGKEGRNFKCQIVQCDKDLSSVFVSRCAMNSRAALSAAIESTGGAAAGFNCIYVVSPVDSGSRRTSFPSLSISILVAAMSYCVYNTIGNVDTSIINASRPHENR